MNTPYHRRICVRGVIVKDGKLFCQELKNSDGSGRGFWCTPGGGLEPGESLEAGLVRELVEETGVTPVVGKLLFIQQYSENKPSGEYQADEYLEFFFHVENPDDFETIDTTASHYDVEVLRCAFIDPAANTILPAFLTQLGLQQYLASDKPVFLHTDMAATSAEPAA